MKPQKIFNSVKGLTFLCFILWGCNRVPVASFGIYLVRGDIPTDQFQVAELDSLALQDEALISGADIVAYDQTTHEITLRSPAYQRLQSLFSLPVDVDGLPFVVCIGSERIYRGAFWTPLSSLSYSGVIILQPMSPGEKRISLTLGYPSIQAFSGQDPRSDSRVLQVLAAEGKLK